MHQDIITVSDETTNSLVVLNETSKNLSKLIKPGFSFGKTKKANAEMEKFILTMEKLNTTFKDNIDFNEAKLIFKKILLVIKTEKTENIREMSPVSQRLICQWMDEMFAKLTVFTQKNLR
jgi:hypothetical protein